MVSAVRGVWAMGLAALALVAACGLAQNPPPAPPRHTSLGLQLSELELSNGLHVVLVHDPRAAEVEVTMRYRVGSVDDPPGEEGMAHLVEHLMFQQVLGAQSLFAHLENDATTFNGGTTFDSTTYYERAQPARLDELLSIEAVRVGSRCTSITESAFEREREVVINELRERDEGTALLTALHGALFPDGHPYRRPTAGSEQSVRAITRDQACAFADAHYTPGNAVLVVSGDLTVDRLEAALRRFLARVPARAAAAGRPAVPPLVPAGHHVDVHAPIDQDALLVAWPLPADPGRRANFRAVASATAAEIEDRTEGQVVELVLGDVRAPVLALVVIPPRGQVLEDTAKRAQQAIETTSLTFREPGTMGTIAFDDIQQSAIYGLYAGLEDGSGRDTRIASYVLAGRDPNEVLGAQFQALRALTRDEGARIAREDLAFDRATMLLLRASGDGARQPATALAPAIHDVGQRRDPPDPADAHRPMAGGPVARGFEGMRTRRLANGLQVVLLPLASVPTVDIRLVFGAGAADDPSGEHGVARLAAGGLTWNLQYLNDWLLFAAAGGRWQSTVDADGISFGARGLDMHLDLLLAGVQRLIREGQYTDADVHALAARAAASGDHGALTDAWRTALFGVHHPYVMAGLPRYAADRLGAEDAQAFRAAYFTPDNATLVIAGRFDPALAERWIDYLFADWTGQAAPRHSPPASPRPTAIASVHDGAQVRLRIALPAAAGDRAHRLVAAAMLGEIADEVRHQLGASYDLQARLVERRLATDYEIAGLVEAGRARDAVDLLRTRIAALREGGDAAARAFVTARRRVVARLLAMTGSAAGLADRVARDAVLGRPPLSDLTTAAAVRALTIDQMTATLADLDLARAVVLMRGPAADLSAAFAALGVKPTYITDRPPPAAPAAPKSDDDKRSISVDEIAAAITEQPGRSSAVALTAGYASAQIGDYDAAGVTLSADLGHRFDAHTAAGLHASIGDVGGSYVTGDLTPVVHPFMELPMDLGGFAQASAYGRLWGALYLGLHVDLLADGGFAPTWHTGISAGLAAGVDLVEIGRHHLGIYAGVEGELIANPGYAATTIGLTYRR